MLCICTSFFSCDHEEEIVVDDNQIFENADFTKNQEEGQEESQGILNAAYVTFFEMEDEEYTGLASTLKDDLIEDATLSDTENISLERIFYVYEGVVNSMFSNQGGEETIMTEEQSENFDDGIRSSDYNFEVAITLDEKGTYIIGNESFNEFHSAVSTTINNFVDESEVQNLLISDFDLVAVSPTVAVVSLSLVSGRSAIPRPQFPIPSGEVYAYDALGWCSNSQPNTIDAADFLRGYANSYKTKPSQCSNVGYLIYLGVFDTQRPKANNTLNQCMENYVWHNHIHPDCIGDDTNQPNNNQIWHNWYSVMDVLVDNPLNYFKQQYLITNPSKRQIRFSLTDYQDFDVVNGVSTGICYKPGYTKYHGGKFYYEVEVCP